MLFNQASGLLQLLHTYAGTSLINGDGFCPHGTSSTMAMALWQHSAAPMPGTLRALPGCASDPDANGWGSANHDKELDFISSGPTPIDEVRSHVRLFAFLLFDARVPFCFDFDSPAG